MMLTVLPEAAPAVSVIVATHNRASRLGQTLDALLGQETPANLGWEIVVVDNASTDGTLEVFRTAAMRAPGRLRYVFERALGKSRALNAGIAVARGDVIALTDDDVSPAADWVATAATVLDRWGADGAGGRILPRWEVTPPSWLLASPRLLAYLAIMEVDSPARLPAPGAEVWGANMVFRRETLRALGGFDVRLGPVGGRRYCEEDTEIVQRLLKAGRTVVYDPALAVFHRIPRARLRRAYFRRVMWDMGEGRARAANAPFPIRSFIGVPRWRFRFMARLFLTSAAHALRRRPGVFEEVLDCMLAAGTTWGEMKRALRGRRGGRRPAPAAPAARAPR
jgi:glycosyltransferase involved in cell wall biosynthesis